VSLRLPLANFWAHPRKLNILPMTGTYFPSYVIPGYLPGRANSADVLRHLHFGAFYFFVKFARPKNLVLGFALRSTCHHHRPSTNFNPPSKSCCRMRRSWSLENWKRCRAFSGQPGEQWMYI